MVVIGQNIPDAELIHTVSTRASELFAAYGPRVIGALIFLAATWVLAGWLSRVILVATRRTHVDITLSKFAAQTSRWVVLLLGVLTCLSIFDVQTTSFAAVIGAAGLAIGLGFQGTLGNLASGIMLLIFRPFKVDDTITVAGVTGRVDEIGLFATSVDTPDNRRVIIPNGAVFGATIENVSYHATRRGDFSLIVAHAASVDVTRQAIQRVLASFEAIDPTPLPAITITDITILGVAWRVEFWASATDVGAIRAGALARLKSEFDAQGIAFGGTKGAIDAIRQASPLI